MAMKLNDARREAARLVRIPPPDLTEDEAWALMMAGADPAGQDRARLVTILRLHGPAVEAE